MMNYIEEVYNETRGRKPQHTSGDSLDYKIELLIAWVEGRYTPRSEVEEMELFEMAEKVYPYMSI